MNTLCSLGATYVQGHFDSECVLIVILVLINTFIFFHKQNRGESILGATKIQVYSLRCMRNTFERTRETM